MLQLAYSYNPRGLIEAITESGADGSATIGFGYDKRGRLTDEARQGTHEYALEYEYDAGGNRTRKARRDVTTWALLEETVYHYDLENPSLYQTKNNRLMYYEVFDGAEEPALLERVDYEYETVDAAVGNPTLIVRKVFAESGSPVYYGTELVYNQSGELWFLIQTTWPDDGSGCSNHDVLSIHEFRSVGRAMRMKMQREADPQSLDYLKVIDGTRRWFDYDGDVIYSDVRIGFEPGTNAIVPTELRAHEPGVGFIDRTSSDAAAYHHGDQTDSARVLTDGDAIVARRLVYTAFGESVYSDGTLATRHQYAGAWGYESELYPPADGNSIPFVHVGHRWYDPEVGRFLQRDPLGILGGLNPYLYAQNSPTNNVDPYGLAPDFLKSKKLKAVGVFLIMVACSLAKSSPQAAAVVGIAGTGAAGGEDLYDGAAEVCHEQHLDLALELMLNAPGILVEQYVEKIRDILPPGAEFP